MHDDTDSKQVSSNGSNIALVEAEMQVLAKNVGEALGLPVTSVGLIETTPTYPPTITEEGRKHVDLLYGFRVAGFPGSFVVTGHDDSDEDGDYYSVLILTQEDGFQAFPPDVEQCARYESKPLAVEYLESGLVRAFVTRMAFQVTQESYSGWLAACRAQRRAAEEAGS